MSERKRVQAYLDKWTGQGVNPENGCHVTYGELASHEDRGSNRIVLGWAIYIGDHEAGEVPNTVSYPGSSETLYPYRSDECFTAAARILKLDNPWRMTSEEMPENNTAVLCRLRQNFDVVAYYHGGLWYGNGRRVTDPYKWMYIPA